ncbi:MAG: TlpA family protein disulfide reductase [Bacteroidia bacterium]
MRFLIIALVLSISALGYSQDIKLVKITELLKRVNNNSDTTYIVNFWATWCAPCVKELPCFDTITTTYPNDKIKILLVSLDFVDAIDTRLIPFIKKKEIKHEIVVLDETNGNYFIPLVSEKWSGVIPATWIVNKNKKVNYFFERKIQFDFLKTKIEEIKAL